MEEQKSVLTKTGGFTLKPGKDPAAWHAMLSYADWVEDVNPDLATAIEQEMYEVRPDRKDLKQANKWNHALKEITNLRRNYLRDRIEHSDFYEGQEKDNDTAE